MKHRLQNLAVITIVAIAAIVFVRTFVNAEFRSPTDTTVPEIITEASDTDAAVSEAPKKHPSPIVLTDRPARLIIPSIGIDAAVQKVGIAKSGAMAVPTNYTDVGWYRGGTIPGKDGTAYFDGHRDNGFGLAGVFKRLGELKSGDKIAIRSENGKVAQFSVYEVTVYPYDAPETTAIFASRSDGAYITLITCGGTWIPEKKTYDKRVVVRARAL